MWCNIDIFRAPLAQDRELVSNCGRSSGHQWDAAHRLPEPVPVTRNV